MTSSISTAAARKAVADALASGALHDVTSDVCNYLPVPVFVTSGVWFRVIMPDESVRSYFQSEETRIAQLLNGLHRAVSRALRKDSRLAPSFGFDATLRMVRYPRWTKVPLVATTAHTDDGFCACIIVMMPDEE